MNIQLSTSEQQGGSPMESAQEKIIYIQHAKEENKITYDDIMVKMAELDEYTMPSLSTLRRVCKRGAEQKATSFNYEEILVPIYNAVKAIEDSPREKTDRDKELDGYKAVIRLQDDELDRLIEMIEQHEDMKKHLEERIAFLISQIELKDKLMDQKDEIIRKLMDKFL